MEPVSSLPPIGLPPSTPPTQPTGTTTTPPTTGTTTPPVGLPPIGTVPSTGLPPATPTPSSGLGVADTFSTVSNYVSAGAAGAVGTLKSVKNLTLIGQGMQGTEIRNPDGSETKVGGGIGAKMKGMSLSIKELGGSAMTGAKYGAIIGGAVSALTNGYKVLTGQESSAQAVGTLAADTVSSTLSGAGGAVAGGVTALALSSFAHVGSLTMLVPSVGVGLIGAVGVNYLIQKTGLYDAIKSKIQGILGAK